MCNFWLIELSIAGSASVLWFLAVAYIGGRKETSGKPLTKTALRGLELIGWALPLALWLVYRIALVAVS